MVRKRKRSAGAGRPPQGEFTQLASVLSVRMPADMRAKLEASKARRDKGKRRSLTQEILSRLQRSFDRERDERRDPASRTLCYLLAEVISTVAHNTTQDKWRSDPFAFRAIKIAFAQILDALEPKGEIRSPQKREGWGPFPADMWISPGTLQGLLGGETPEDMARFIRDLILMRLSSEPTPPPTGEGFATVTRTRTQQDFEFGMSDARRHLKLTEELK